MNNHGLESNKNIFFYKHKLTFLLDLMDGQVLDSQEFKDLTIVQLEVMLILEDLLQMLIINAVCMQELKFLEQMQKYSLVNGNSKLDHV